ncbi:MAG: hypothetical protein JW807_00740 [Spirochaetes bacterium]|nr:hypothetical protein [Spirochaetota bacterium]
MTRNMTKSNHDAAIVKIDAETGREVSFTETDVQDLRLFEQAIVASWIQEAVALRNIANRKLYLLHDCPTMKDYLMEYYKKSYRHALRLLFITDKINPDKLTDLTEIPMTKLLEIARDDGMVDKINEGDASLDADKVVYADGTFESLDDVIARAKREAKREEGKERDKLKAKIEKANNKLSGKDFMLKNLEDQLQESIDRTKRLEESLQSLMSEKGVDPKTIVFITHKKQAVELIDESMREALKRLADIDNIPKDLVDAELGGRMALAVSSVEAACERIRDNWGMILWLPGKVEHPTDVVPE